MIQFSSGGRQGPRLNYDLFVLPESNNIYGAFINKHTSKQSLAESFYSYGWSVRKSSYEDFEIEYEWIQFEIVGEENVLFSGIIDVTKIENFNMTLKEIGIQCSFEVYNSDEIMVYQKKS